MAISQDQYTKVAIGLHWAIAFLIIAQIAGGKFMHQLPATSFKFELYQWHKSFGILVLGLSVARLIWRLRHKAPALPDGMNGYERFAAKATHVIFYFLMIGIPLTGWAMVSVSPKTIPTVLFKIIPLPHLPVVPQSETLERLFANMHEILAVGTLVLLALHVGAALKHHYKDKDDVLIRMLPFLKQRGSR